MGENSSTCFKSVSVLAVPGGNPMSVNGAVGVQPQSQASNLLQDPMLHVNLNAQK